MIHVKLYRCAIALIVLTIMSVRDTASALRLIHAIVSAAILEICARVPASDPF